MTIHPVRVGLIGFGWFAELLCTRVFPFVPEISVVAVCDRLPQRRDRAHEILKVPVFEDSADLLRESDCEGVIIMTPHNTHRVLVEAAAASGKHIFCEKAMAVTVEDCRAMITAAEAGRVTLLIGHMQKLIPPYSRVIELVREGRYGKVLAMQVFGFHWCPVFDGWWRTKDGCGGLLYWTGIHDLDTMRAIVGDDVVEVYAVSGPKTERYTEYEDIVAVTLKYRGGAIGSLQVAEHDTLREFSDSFSLSVLCERGSIRYIPDARIVQHRARARHVLGELCSEQLPSHEENENAAYRAEFSHFGNVVRGQEPLRLTARDGLKCVETLQAIYRSIEEQRPVRIAGL